MKTGMLWFDNSQSTLTVKVTKAVDYYKRKYGRQPDLCLVHPSILATGLPFPEPVKGVKVRPYRPVLPGHIWIGFEDEA